MHQSAACLGQPCKVENLQGLPPTESGERRCGGVVTGALGFWSQKVWGPGAKAHRIIQKRRKYFPLLLAESGIEKPEKICRDGSQILHK